MEVQGEDFSLGEEIGGGFEKISEFGSLSSIEIEEKLEEIKEERDLNKTPLPLFDCIYCSGEGIVFDNMINEGLNSVYGSICTDRDFSVVRDLTCRNPTKEGHRLSSMVSPYFGYFTKVKSRGESKEILDKYSKMQVLPCISKMFSQPKESELTRNMSTEPQSSKKYLTQLRQLKIESPPIKATREQLDSYFHIASLEQSELSNPAQLDSNLQVHSQVVSWREESNKANSKAEPKIDSLQPSFNRLVHISEMSRVKPSDLSLESTVHDIYNPDLSFDFIVDSPLTSKPVPPKKRFTKAFSLKTKPSKQNNSSKTLKKHNKSTLSKRLKTPRTATQNIVFLNKSTNSSRKSISIEFTGTKFRKKSDFGCFSTKFN